MLARVEVCGQEEPGSRQGRVQRAGQTGLPTVVSQVRVEGPGPVLMLDAYPVEVADCRKRSPEFIDALGRLECCGACSRWRQVFTVDDQAIESVRASGWKGQFIYIFSSLDMVVVFTMYNDNPHALATSMSSQYLLPAALGAGARQPQPLHRPSKEADCVSLPSIPVGQGRVEDP